MHLAREVSWLCLSSWGGAVLSPSTAGEGEGLRMFMSSHACPLPYSMSEAGKAMGKRRWGATIQASKPLTSIARWLSTHPDTLRHYLLFYRGWKTEHFPDSPVATGGQLQVPGKPDVGGDLLGESMSFLKGTKPTEKEVPCLSPCSCTECGCPIRKAASIWVTTRWLDEGKPQRRAEILILGSTNYWTNVNRHLSLDSCDVTQRNPFVMLLVAESIHNCPRVSRNFWGHKVLI